MLPDTLLILILLLILTEMYFLGRYVSVTQGIFSNKSFAIIVLGGVIYFALTFITIVPFMWIKWSVAYFAIFIGIKDFMTLVFLLARREKFKEMHINYNFIIFSIISAVSIPLLYQYVFPYIFHFSQITANTSHHFLYIFEESISKILSTSIHKISMYIMSPIVGVMIVSTVTSFWLNFSKHDSVMDYAFSYILAIGLMIFFNFQKGPSEILGFFLLIFIILVAYHLIIYSRRRYGSLFGLLNVVIWGINPDLYFPLFTISFITSIVYVLLGKPKALLFSVQLLSPVVILATFYVMSFSTALAWSLLVFGLLGYTSIFMLGHVNFIEKVNKVFESFESIKYIIPVIIFIIILITGVTLGTTENTNPEIVFQNKLVFDFNNKIVSNIVEGVYYGVIFFILFYAIYWIIRREKMVKWKLTNFIIALTVLFFYNPLTNIIVREFDTAGTYQYLSMFILPPIFIGFGAKLRTNYIRS